MSTAVTVVICCLLSAIQYGALSDSSVRDEVDITNAKSIALGQFSLSERQIELLQRQNDILLKQLEASQALIVALSNQGSPTSHVLEYLIIALINLSVFILGYYLRKRIAAYVQGIFLRNNERILRQSQRPEMPRTESIDLNLLELGPIEVPPNKIPVVNEN